MSDVKILNPNSTFGAVSEKYRETETTTNNNAVETTSTENNATVETNNAPVTNNGEVVNNIVEQANAAETTTTPAPEANESNFSLGFEDEVQTTTQEATAQTQQQEINLDDILKKYDKKEVAKKLGFSDFTLEMDEHLARGGRADDYINAKGINWDSVSDLDILKLDFNKKYEYLDAADKEYLFQKKYGITDLDDDEVRREKAINIKIDAGVSRNERKAEQAKFKLPEAKAQQEVPQEFTEWQQNVQRQQQESEAAKQFIQNHPAIQNLLTSKRVTIELGEGVKPFNYNVDKPDLIVRAILDGSFYRKFITNKQGELDVERLKKITLYAADPDRHDRDMFNYGKSHGVQTLVNEGQNAQRPQGVGAAPDLGSKEVKIKGTGTVGQHTRNR